MVRAGPQLWFILSAAKYVLFGAVPGAVRWHGGCGKSTPIGPDALSCRFNGLIATYGIMPEATGQESQQKGRHGELCLPTSAN